MEVEQRIGDVKDDEVDGVADDDSQSAWICSSPGGDAVGAHVSERGALTRPMLPRDESRTAPLGTTLAQTVCPRFNFTT